MVILISGASHTGKTLLAQKLLEKHHYPYLSIDHLKMGLIRSGYTTLTPMSDDAALTGYLWPILVGIIQTVVENKQNLIVEGCYIPFDWQRSFAPAYLAEIEYHCLVMSERYIENHFDQIKRYACAIESRLDDGSCTKEALQRENAAILRQCQEHRLGYLLIDDEYRVDIG